LVLVNRALVVAEGVAEGGKKMEIMDRLEAMAREVVVIHRILVLIMGLMEALHQEAILMLLSNP
jgi:hypothetical protein